MIQDDHRPVEVEEENYFVSMTDMMVGFIFIFIILLMYFALQFQNQREEYERVNDELTGASKTRADILAKIANSLKDQGVDVIIDPQNGVLRLPDSILFDSGQAHFKPGAQEKIEILAQNLATILPCYADSLQDVVVPTGTCTDNAHKIESLFIEGHTDKDPLRATGYLADNWDLSVVRATNTYRAMTKASPELEQLCVRKGESCEPILSVSGYGSQRPIDPGSSSEAKQANRRIDLRIIMVTPDGGKAADKIAGAIAGH